MVGEEILSGHHTVIVYTGVPLPKLTEQPDEVTAARGQRRT